MTTKLAIFAFLLALLSGCAVIDTSVLDTAEPLKQGNVKFETYGATGLNLQQAVNVSDDEIYEDSVDDYDNLSENIAWPLAGLKMGIGIADSSEIGIKGWLALGNGGGKLYYKKVLKQKDNTYQSIIPAVTFTSSKTKITDNDDIEHLEVLYNKYSSIGVEFPYVITTKASEYVSISAAIKLNYDYFKYQYYDEDEFLHKHGPYNILHGGIVGNIRFKLAFLTLCPELGVEIIPVVNGHVTAMPNIGCAAGLQF